MVKFTYLRFARNCFPSSLESPLSDFVISANLDERTLGWATVSSLPLLGIWLVCELVSSWELFVCIPSKGDSLLCISSNVGVSLCVMLSRFGAELFDFCLRKLLCVNESSPILLMLVDSSSLSDPLSLDPNENFCKNPWKRLWTPCSLLSEEGWEGRVSLLLVNLSLVTEGRGGGMFAEFTFG